MRPTSVLAASVIACLGLSAPPGPAAALGAPATPSPAAIGSRTAGTGAGEQDRTRTDAIPLRDVFLLISGITAFDTDRIVIDPDGVGGSASWSVRVKHKLIYGTTVPISTRVLKAATRRSSNVVAWKQPYEERGFMHVEGTFTNVEGGISRIIINTGASPYGDHPRTLGLDVRIIR